MILGIAFLKTVAQMVLAGLTVDSKLVIPSSIKGVDQAVEMINITEATWVIAFGSYSGRDNQRLRIETVAQNKFRNSQIDNDLETVSLGTFLKPGNKSKYAAGLGNSFCNLLSYKAQRLINSGELNVKYSFIHIPRGFDVSQAISEINQMINLMDVTQPQPEVI